MKGNGSGRAPKKITPVTPPTKAPISPKQPVTIADDRSFVDRGGTSGDALKNAPSVKPSTHLTVVKTQHVRFTNETSPIGHKPTSPAIPRSDTDLAHDPRRQDAPLRPCAQRITAEDHPRKVPGTLTRDPGP